MQNTPIIIKKKYLIFRSETENLKKAIKEKGGDSFYLDFSKVSFFSRSFGDELLNTIEDFEGENIRIEIINLKPNLKLFLQKIKSIKQKIRKEMK